MQRLLLATVLKVSLCSGCLWADDANVTPDIQLKLQTIYKTTESKLKEDSISYQKDNVEKSDSLKIEIRGDQWEPITYTIQPNDFDKGALVQVWANGLQFRSVLNKALYQALQDKKITQQVPQLSVKQAFDRAKSYLNHYQISLSAGLKLKNATFNVGVTPACWAFEWDRIIDGYSWDESGWSEGVSLVFHETKGLVSVGNNVYTPLPKKLDVVMTRDQAIAKATICAPLVERTPFYKSCRLDGFVLNGMISCELKVSVPNYLLDPQRANWERTTPPDETRLCWVVRFTTVDSKADQRNMKGKLIPPDIIIYLDAATGECVGANFT